MAGKSGQKKRFGSDDEQRSICEQTTKAGVFVMQVTQRYAMNANLIHKCVCDPRSVPVTDASDVGVVECDFSPSRLKHQHRSLLA